MNTQTSRSQTRRPVLVAATVALVVLAGAGCGRPSTDTRTGAPAPAPAPTPTATGVAPDSTALPGVGGVDVETPVPAGGVVVVENSVALDPRAATWTARGLVRNDTADVLDEVSVEATLVGADGSLTTARADSPVRAVRPGEPVPFVIEADLPRADVASVRWTATGVAGGDASSRELTLATYWTRPYGDPRPVRIPARDESTTSARPFLLFGSVTATTAGAGVDRPVVTAAWRDADGRITDVRTVPAVAPDGAAVAALAPGAAADFLVVVDDAVLGPAADAAPPMLWGGGS